ncbi:MAG: NADH-quinone oxidoreductase subunit N [Ignavibacteriaceae bacterium]|nr:NADH-quinone oxidoreductase subunit N [Ignavibacteriaceae bacterium]
MNVDYLVNSLYLIKPELAIASALVLLVLIDLIMGNNKKFLPYVAIAGLIAAAYFIIGQFGMNSLAFVSKSNKGMIIADPFGAFFKGIVVFASLFVVYFSIKSDEIKASFERHGEYYTLIFGMILGMFFMISASDLILIYISLELVSFSSYVLAGFTKTALRNSEAALKYVIYGGVSSGIMLFGISILYGITGSTNLYEINSLIQSSSIPNLTFILSGILIFVGIGYKISAAPFHFWTPDVYEGAPITITAFLSVASKAAGFALLIRFIKITFIKSVDSAGYWQLVDLIDWKTFFIFLSIITMTLGNFAALWQDNLKRMLAYSSIAHAGYLLLGMAVLSNQGMIAIIIYFAVYAITNLGAFFVVMLIANKIGSENIDDYKGLGYSQPFLGVSLAIFLISLTGLPPTAGFIGKLYLFIALVDAKMITLAVIALLNSVVALYYYIRVLKNLFLSRPANGTFEFKVSFSNGLVLVLLAAPIIILGIYFTPLVDLAKNSMQILGF